MREADAPLRENARLGRQPTADTRSHQRGAAGERHEHSQPVSRNPGGSVAACDRTGTGAHRRHIRTARLRALQLLLSDAAQHERSFLSQALELLLFIACAIAWLGCPRGPWVARTVGSRACGYSHSALGYSAARGSMLHARAAPPG
jgi:hypothetical protein